MLARPFYFVIRGQRIRWIDLENERNENGHCTFANWSKAFAIEFEKIMSSVIFLIVRYVITQTLSR